MAATRIRSDRTDRLGIALAAALAATSAAAQNGEFFTITATVPGPGGDVSESQSFTDFDAFRDGIEDGVAFPTLGNVYTQTGAVVGDFVLRGAAFAYTFPDAAIGSPSRLTVTSPALPGGVFSVDAGSRAASAEAFAEFVEDNTEVVTNVLQTAVATTPNDPLAGNPASLLTRSMVNDFATASAAAPGGTYDAIEGAIEGGDARFVSAGVTAGFFVHDTDTTLVELPIAYTIPLADPRWGVILSAPVSFFRSSEVDVYSASLGAGLRVPLYDNWDLTPSVRFGGYASEDLASLSGLVTASLTSNYETSFRGVEITFGNMLGLSRSVPLDFVDTTFDYELFNFVTRNGVAVSGDLPVTLFALPTTWQVSLVNTHFFGDELFVENSTDLAVSFGTERSENGFVWDELRVGLTLTITDEDFNGASVNFGYRF